MALNASKRMCIYSSSSFSSQFSLSSSEEEESPCFPSSSQSNSLASSSAEALPAVLSLSLQLPLSSLLSSSSDSEVSGVAFLCDERRFPGGTTLGPGGSTLLSLTLPVLLGGRVVVGFVVRWSQVVVLATTVVVGFAAGPTRGGLRPSTMSGSDVMARTVYPHWLLLPNDFLFKAAAKTVFSMNETADDLLLSSMFKNSSGVQNMIYSSACKIMIEEWVKSEKIMTRNRNREEK